MCSPYSGSGRLTEWGRGGSWILNQLSSGSPGGGVSLGGDDGFVRFASRLRRISSRVASSAVASRSDYSLERRWKVLSSLTGSDFRVLLTWSLSGDFDGCSLDGLSAASGLVDFASRDDYSSLSRLFRCEVESADGPCVDFSLGRLRLSMVCSIGAGVCSDLGRISSELGRLGFSESSL